MLFLACLYKSTGRAIVLTKASAAAALTKLFKCYIKVFKTVYFLNPEMDLVFSTTEHEVIMKCSRWAIMFTLCPLNMCPASCVVNIYVVHPLEATVLLQSSWNFTRIFDMMISRSDSNMGHVRSKTRSVGQISLKPCSPSRGHSYASILMKLYQNVCLDDSTSNDSSNMDHVGSKTRSLGQISLKPCSPSRGHSFALFTL